MKDLQCSGFFHVVTAISSVVTHRGSEIAQWESLELAPDVIAKERAPDGHGGPGQPGVEPRRVFCAVGWCVRSNL